jgi:hypothetical protein
MREHVTRRGVKLDVRAGMMECQTCGREWAPMLGSGGRILRGGWLCPNGCNAAGAPAGEPGQAATQ